MTEYKMLTLSFLELMDALETLSTYPFIAQNGYRWTVGDIEADFSLQNALFAFTVNNIEASLDGCVKNRYNKKPSDKRISDVYVIKLLASSITEAPEKWRPGFWSLATSEIYQAFSSKSTLYLEVTDTLYDVVVDIVRKNVTAEDIVEFSESEDDDIEDIEKIVDSLDAEDSLPDIHDKIIAYTSFWIDRFNEE